VSALLPRFWRYRAESAAPGVTPGSE
jgi:hypothetical protein